MTNFTAGVPEHEEPTWRILADTGVLANDKI